MTPLTHGAGRANADHCRQLVLLLCIGGHVAVQQVCSPRLSLGVLLGVGTALFRSVLLDPLRVPLHPRRVNA